MEKITNLIGSLKKNDVKNLYENQTQCSKTSKKEEVFSDQLIYIYSAFNRYFSTWARKYDSNDFKSLWDKEVKNIDFETIKNTVDNVVTGKSHYKQFPPDLNDFLNLVRCYNYGNNDSVCEMCSIKAEELRYFVGGKLVIRHLCAAHDEKEKVVYARSNLIYLLRKGRDFRSPSDALNCIHLYKEIFGIFPSKKSESDVIVNIKTLRKDVGKPHAEKLLNAVYLLGPIFSKAVKMKYGANHG